MSHCMCLCCRKRFTLVLRATVCLQSTWRMHQERVRYLALLAEEARRIAAELEEEERKRQALEEEERERRRQEELEWQLASAEQKEATVEKEASPSRNKSMAVYKLDIPASLAFTLHCMNGWCMCTIPCLCQWWGDSSRFCFHFMPSGWDPPHPLLAFMDIWSKLVPLERAHLTLPADVDSFAFQKFAGTYFQVRVCEHIHCTSNKWQLQAMIGWAEDGCGVTRIVFLGGWYKTERGSL